LQIIAKTFHGLEEVLAQEVKALGGKDIRVLKRAVSYEGDQKLLYRSVYELRTALRILKPFYSFKTKHENHLYKKIKEIDWVNQFNLDQTFVINAVTASKYFQHSQYLALKAKDAIVDSFREVHDRQRPSIDRINPDFRINLHLGFDNVCTLAWDASGDSLHKRGYRLDTVEAPINEVLAAGMILESGWQKDCALIDPMCGSGTILTEAALYAYNMPPQIQRKQFGFMKWKDFDRELWETVKREAEERMVECNVPILGFDKDFRAVKASTKNILAAELEGAIEINRIAIEELEVSEEKAVVITNPPYDERMELEDVMAFYKDLGYVLKDKLAGYTLWIISSNGKALKQLGLKPSARKTLFNGPLECQYNCYELFKSSKKA